MSNGFWVWQTGDLRYFCFCGLWTGRTSSLGPATRGRPPARLNLGVRVAVCSLAACWPQLASPAPCSGECLCITRSWGLCRYYWPVRASEVCSNAGCCLHGTM